MSSLKGAPKPAVVLKPKNVIIQWEPPETTISTRIRDLGTVVADPNEYMRRFGDSVIDSDELPAFVHKMPPPKGERFAADCRQLAPTPPPLYGDLHALRLVDLDREGLAEYKPQLARTATGSRMLATTMMSHQQRIKTAGPSRSTSVTMNAIGGSSATTMTTTATIMNSQPTSANNTLKSTITNLTNNNPNRAVVSPLIHNIFSNINLNKSGHISIDEMNKTFSKLNNCLGREYGPTELNEFFANMDSNRDGYVDLAEFKNFFKKNIV